MPFWWQKLDRKLIPKFKSRLKYLFQAKAKTIDLCNNPLTKEPKLQAAVRIVPEWVDYDNQITQLLTGQKVTEEVKTDPKTEL